MPQNRSGLSRVMVAVMTEIDDLTPDLRLQPPGGTDFGDQIAPGEEPARLLAKGDDWLLANDVIFPALVSFDLFIANRTTSRSHAPW